MNIYYLKSRYLMAKGNKKYGGNKGEIIVIESLPVIGTILLIEGNAL